MSTETKQTNTSGKIITPEQLLAHWQGHRSLTRRTIEVFPEKDFFNYTIGGMRPFATMIKELLAIAGPGIEGIVTEKWQEFNEDLKLSTKEDILKLWDETTVKIDTLWNGISESEFQKEIVAFGQYDGTIQSTILYFIDNEIHHRGQGYVYLRFLGIEPPMFWDRN
ncbi:DinB family protein [Zhouia spongiae]|uniref:DinB family protein n=1 Tax=Zhouia spongiae TaxID=2202721 RepID=A0ABY3YIM8_9FLAO|nr:DinB family protein [Zhouia spongiae]UNY97553.1 DinB family protein [Zhouia spongiae]